MVLILKRARRAGVVASLTVASLGVSVSARADGEAWLWTEHQAALDDGKAVLPTTNLRLTTNARLSGRNEGLDFGLVRAGPVFAVSPWLSTAITGAAIATRSPSGAFVQEYRTELDLVPRAKFGSFALSDRNRVEYVWRAAGSYVRDRNMLRIAYAPEGALWIPFAFVDLFMRPTKPHLQETWSALGLGRVLGGAARLDLAYLVRTRDGSGGELDHVAWLMLFFGVPETKAAARAIDVPDAVD